ncbi:hypothetical protein KY348_00470 [Candidatus Woesearchaeota archaeon]|nr:hypothetical protein [Candidatus Woesearchaeota archaeon]
MKPLFSKNKKKKGLSTLGTIIGLILLLAVLAIFLPVILRAGKTTDEVPKDIMDPVKACHGKESGEECYLGGIAGFCRDFRCVIETSAKNMKESITIFKTTFKDSIENCQKDVAQCPEATKALDLMIGYFTDAGLVVHRLASDRAEFRLYQEKNFLGIGGHKASFVFYGDTCVIEKKGDNDVPTSGKNFKLGIKKESKGFVVYDLEKTAAELGTFISFRHQTQNDATTPVCVYYTTD